MRGATGPRLHSGVTSAELVITISLIWIVAVVVISATASDMMQFRELSLRNNVRMLRGQITLYQLQHQDHAPDARRLETLLLGRTNEAGEIGTPDARLRPYIPRWPANPFNGKNTVRGVATADEVKADDKTGWIYQTDGQGFMLVPNSAGKDSEGVALSDY